MRHDKEEKEKANSKTHYERLMAAEGTDDPTAGACLSFALLRVVIFKSQSIWSGGGAGCVRSGAERKDGGQKRDRGELVERPKEGFGVRGTVEQFGALLPVGDRMWMNGLWTHVILSVALIWFMNSPCTLCCSHMFSLLFSHLPHPPFALLRVCV